MLDRLGVSPEENESICRAVPATLSAMRELVEDYLEVHPLCPETPLPAHKVLNFVFEKAARFVFGGEAYLPPEGPFTQGVERVIRRGRDNIGPAGYGCELESMEELLDFFEFRKFLNEEFDARADAKQLLSFKKEYIHFILDQIPGKSGGRILDLGCGYGTIAYHLARPGSEVVGVDYSFSRVEKIAPLFERMAARGRVDIRWGDATQLLFPDAYFDQVISADLVEHMGPGEQHQFLAEVRRVLRPGGEWYIATPNLAYLRLTTLARKFRALSRPGAPGERLARFRAEKIPYTPGASVGHGQHIGLLEAGRLARLARRAGLCPAEADFFIRSDIPSRLPGAFREAIKVPPFRGWVSAWFLVKGTVP